MRVSLYLKTGSIVEFDADSVTTTRNGLGELSKLEWNKSGQRVLQYVDLAQVVAVVADHSTEPVE